MKDEVLDGGSDLRVGSGGLDERAAAHLGAWTGDGVGQALIN